MEAYKFETIIPENGMIQVPNYEKLRSKKVEVLLLLKPGKEENLEEYDIEAFVDNWFGYFPEIDTDDVRYNAIIGKEK